MAWQEFGPMMRRQQRAAEERRQDRQERGERIRDRRSGAAADTDEPDVACPECNETRPARAMVLTGDGQRCAHCIADQELSTDANRALRMLIVAAPASALAAALLLVVSFLVFRGEPNIVLVATGLGIVASATGWSAWRRARSLLHTADVLDIDTALAQVTRKVGLAVAVVGMLVVLATPVGWLAQMTLTATASPETVQQILELQDGLQPHPADGLKPSGASDHVERVVWENLYDDGYWERKREAMKDR